MPYQTDSTDYADLLRTRDASGVPPGPEILDRETYQLPDWGSDWDNDGYAVLVNPAGELLITLSIQFIRVGHVNNVRYALEQVHLSYIGTLGSKLSVEGGPSLAGEVALEAGTYVVHPPNGLTDFVPRHGARWNLSTPVPVATQNGEYVEGIVNENSIPNAEGKSKFGNLVAYRDHDCLLTDLDYEECAACHIVPFNQPSYYKEVLGRHGENFMFHVSAGLLLNHLARPAFERGDIAFYPVDGRLVVHVFRGAHRKNHGQIIDPAERFRGPQQRWPNGQLLMFHYQQCSMKHFRNYSVWRAPSSDGILQ